MQVSRKYSENTYISASFSQKACIKKKKHIIIITIIIINLFGEINKEKHQTMLTVFLYLTLFWHELTWQVIVDRNKSSKWKVIKIFISKRQNSVLLRTLISFKDSFTTSGREFKTKRETKSWNPELNYYKKIKHNCRWMISMASFQKLPHVY